MKILSIILTIILNGTLVQCSSAPENNSTNEKIVTEVIQKSIVVYGSHQCPHCVNFKAKLDSIGLEYTFYDVDVSDQYALEMVARVKASGHTEGISIPVVVVNDQQLFIAPHISKVLAALD